MGTRKAPASSCESSHRSASRRQCRSSRSCRRRAAGEPFIDDAKAGFHFRTYYYDKDNPNVTENEAWAAGGWLYGRTDWFRDFLHFGATGYFSLPVCAPDDKDGTALLKNGQDGYEALADEYEYDTGIVRRYSQKGSIFNGFRTRFRYVWVDDDKSTGKEKAAKPRSTSTGTSRSTELGRGHRDGALAGIR